MSSRRSGSIDEHDSSVARSNSSPATAARASVDLRSRSSASSRRRDELGDGVGNGARVERAAGRLRVEHELGHVERVARGSRRELGRDRVHVVGELHSDALEHLDEIVDRQPVEPERRGRQPALDVGERRGGRAVGVADGDHAGDRAARRVPGVR